MMMDGWMGWDGMDRGDIASAGYRAVRFGDIRGVGRLGVGASWSVRVVWRFGFVLAVVDLRYTVCGMQYAM